MINIEIHFPPTADRDEAVADGLVRLTEAISRRDERSVAHGCLGGNFGYGANFRNDVFAMRPFDWEPECTCGQGAAGDQWHRDHAHRSYCYQVELETAKIAACLKPWEARDLAWPDYDDAQLMENSIYAALCDRFNVPSAVFGIACHCTCGFGRACRAWFDAHRHADDCRLELPNFHHIKSGLKVCWYKWIGRDMSIIAPGAIDLSALFTECIRSVSA